MSTGSRELRHRRIARALLVLIALCIAAIVFWPTRPAASGQGALELFFIRAHRNGLPQWIGFALIEWLSNVVMFAPLGFLAVFAVKRSHRWAIIPAAFAGSCLIELTQLFFLPNRVSSVGDVAANTCGAAAGWLLGIWSSRRLVRRSQPTRR